MPTPLFDDGIFFITNGHGRSPTFAVSADAHGDLTLAAESEEKKDAGKDGDKSAETVDESDDNVQRLPEGLVWHQPRDGSYMPTPIIVNGRLYTCNDNGRLTVRDCKTGEEVYKQRVGIGPAASAEPLSFLRKRHRACLRLTLGLLFLDPLLFRKPKE